MTDIGKSLGVEHWEWLSTLLEKVYVDAFAHGYKHGYDDACDDIFGGQKDG